VLFGFGQRSERPGFDTDEFDAGKALSQVRFELGDHLWGAAIQVVTQPVGASTIDGRDHQIGAVDTITHLREPEASRYPHERHAVAEIRVGSVQQVAQRIVAQGQRQRVRIAEMHCPTARAALPRQHLLHHGVDLERVDTNTARDERLHRRVGLRRLCHRLDHRPHINVRRL
jgi:hypothetical protein